MIVCKKNIVNKKGEREQLNVYSSSAECKLEGEPHKIIKRGGKTLGYVGLTRDLDTPKASSKRVKIGNKIYAERKYLGKTSMKWYMRDNYSDYQTITEITKNMIEDTSDCNYFNLFFRDTKKVLNFPKIDTRNGVDFSALYYDCNNGIEFPLLNTSKGIDFSMFYTNCKSSTTFPEIDTSQGTNFYAMFLSCNSATSFPRLNTSQGTNFSTMYEECYGANTFPLLDTSKGTNFERMYNKCYNSTSFPRLNTSQGTNLKLMYYRCRSATIFPQLDTSKCIDYYSMYGECTNAQKISDIDLSSITTEDITINNKFDYMLNSCTSLKSVTFNNVPPGITVEQMRTATRAPSTCEIILNHRNE